MFCEKSVSALGDVKVIEYGEFICAPYCGKMLADLGADVIKIENPITGDSVRRRGPFLDDIPGSERSLLFLDLNTNKRGITLNPEKATGREIFMKLVKDADILIEDTKPGTMDDLGLGYHVLKSLNQQLIITSITPFGQTGPYKYYKSSDLIAVQMSGIGYITPRWVGTSEQEPLRVQQVYSYIVGITAAAATMSALNVQRYTGRGQQVDVSLLEAMVTSLNYDGMYWPYQQKNVTRASKPEYAPIHFIKCKDGWVQATVVTDDQWHKFVDLMGNPEWANAELFSDFTSRGEHWESLEPLITDWSSKYTKDELLEGAKIKKVPLAPVYSVAEVLERKQFKERDFFVDIEHPTIGKLTYPGAPYKLQKTPWEIRRAAPLLGQHNVDIYCNELGYTKEELIKMYEAQII